MYMLPMPPAGGLPLLATTESFRTSGGFSVSCCYSFPLWLVITYHLQVQSLSSAPLPSCLPFVFLHFLPFTPESKEDEEVLEVNFPTGSFQICPLSRSRDLIPTSQFPVQLRLRSHSPARRAAWPSVGPSVAQFPSLLCLFRWPV